MLRGCRRSGFLRRRSRDTLHLRILLSLVLAGALVAPANAFAQSGNIAPAARPQAAADAYDTQELINAAHQLNAGELARLQARAETGEGRAQVLLGLAYEMGSAGLMPQPSQALSWFLKAADQGVTWAAVWAADFYLSGSPGIDQDFARALKLYRSAADRGDPRAAFFVGQMYFYGDGVPADHREAASWYKRATTSDIAAARAMIALTESPCASAFCVAFRQVVGAVLTDAASRFIDGWDEGRHEWDSTITLPDSERCGLTSSDRTSVGDVQNYFCDSAQVADEARGRALAKQIADTVQRALPAAYSRSDRDDVRPGPSTFFALEDYPHIRVTFNVTPGSAQNRVTLLVGP